MLLSCANLVRAEDSPRAEAYFLFPGAARAVAGYWCLALTHDVGPSLATVQPLRSSVQNDRGWSARVMYQEQEAARVARARAVNQAHGHAWVKGSRSGEWEFKETKKTVLPSISNNRPRVSHRLYG